MLTPCRRCRFGSAVRSAQGGRLGSQRNKVLVIGGAGYVGSVLVQQLLDRGYAVRVFDRLVYGSLGLAGLRDRIELIVGDMRAMEPRHFEDVAVVVNLGGISNDPTAEFNPEANHDLNTAAAERTAMLAKQAGVQRYVLASTCSIYDRGVDDAADSILDESAEVNPKAAYSSSKYEAEKLVLPMQDDDFCPVALRKGTVYGYSPRMRFDLVVNSFVKDALAVGELTVHSGGEMWRPLVEVRDAARAYIAVVEADANKVRGEIFNVVRRNIRISELALRVAEALRSHGVDTAITPEYGDHAVRSYRVSGDKLSAVLGYRSLVSIEESVARCVASLRSMSPAALQDPRYYNLRWLQFLTEAEEILGVPGALFSVPEARRRAPSTTPLRSLGRARA